MVAVVVVVKVGVKVGQEEVGGACSLAPLLLAQELEDGGEVLGGVAAGAHDPEDLVGQRAQRDGGPGVGGRVLGQAQVLQGERSKVRWPFHKDWESGVKRKQTTRALTDRRPGFPVLRGGRYRCGFRVT